MEAAIGFEPMIRALQARALPLGYAAEVAQTNLGAARPLQGGNPMGPRRQSSASSAANPRGNSTHCPARGTPTTPVEEKSTADRNSAWGP